MGFTPEYGTRVTCEDSDGHQETQVIRDDWCVIVDGRCYVAHINKFRNGTAVITVKLDDAATPDAGADDA